MAQFRPGLFGVPSRLLDGTQARRHNTNSRPPASPGRPRRLLLGTSGGIDGHVKDDMLEGVEPVCRFDHVESQWGTPTLEE
ncbi:hypothetical protein AAFF_G00329710 [Aldrovandia affinis]|uniref:Uncharacterized protein n=1 Tax=Aldrovandia affinis TaxID=143900 RepID=A0AAD7SLY8_9TELE|nr:hypothetical protein AAFF_G00329710 [Aldrovandia affinis]